MTQCVAKDIHARKFIGNNTFSAQAFEAIKSWVNECDGASEHSHCAVIRDRIARAADSSSKNFIPTRLLYVGSIAAPLIRLVSDTRKAEVRGPYTSLRFDVCVSHLESVLIIIKVTVGETGKFSSRYGCSRPTSKPCRRPSSGLTYL
jgi:hypothetical protein